MDSRSDKQHEQGISDEKKASSPVISRMFQKGYRFDFFQAAYLLEKLYKDDAPPGEEGPLKQEAVRFRPSTRLSFPSSDVYRVNKRDSEHVQGIVERPEIVQMVLSFMGLYGVDSPLPPYFPDMVVGLDKEPEEDIDEREEESGARALRGFLDIFNHRIYSLLYRSWKKYRYYLQFEEGARDRFSQYMLSLIGLGTPALQDLVGVEPSRLIAYTGIIGRQAHCATGLQGILSDYFGGIDSEVIEFMPRWVPIPKEYQTTLGSKGVRARLGESVTIGKRIRDLSGKFRVVLGPLKLEKFRRFLPGGKDSKELYSLVKFYAPDQLSFDVELMMKKEDVPALRLGDYSAQLGWTSWLGKPSEDVVSIAFSLENRLMG